MLRLVIDRIKSPITLLLVILSMASCEQVESTLVEEFEVAEAPVTSVEVELLNQVNDLRAEGCTCGDKFYDPVGELTFDKKLEEAAVRHSNDMSDNRHFDHVGTDGSTFTDRISDTGYTFFSAGENIAYGYNSASSVLNGWKHSVGHCKILMDSKATEIGVSSVNGYWTLVIAKPNSGK